MLLFRLEGEEGDFWGGTDTHWHGAAKSDVHVEVMVAIGIETIVLIIDETGNGPAEDAELSGMGVAGEREGCRTFYYLSTPMGWVVSEDDRIMAFRAFRGFLQVTTGDDMVTIQTGRTGFTTGARPVEERLISSSMAKRISLPLRSRTRQGFL